MKVRTSFAQALKKTLYESLDAEMIERVVKDVIPGYDLRQRAGFPPNIPIMGQTAAARACDDIVESDLVLAFIERLAKLDREGFMGRTYRMAGLRDLIKLIGAEGYLWDAETGLFMEDPRVRRTANWGRLVEGEEIRASLLRIDIVNNSRLVKVHGEEATRQAYEDLRGIFTKVVERRYGRVWNFEGDGAFASFLYGHSATTSVLAGMALVHELFMYNRLYNKIGEPLKIRAAVHTGPLRYSSDFGQILKQETCREVIEAESRWTPPEALSVTAAVAGTLDRVLLDRFKKPGQAGARTLLYRVELGAL